VMATNGLYYIIRAVAESEISDTPQTAQNNSTLVSSQGVLHAVAGLFSAGNSSIIFTMDHLLLQASP